MIDEAFKSGDEDARRDIAAGTLRLHYGLRGEWGQDLKKIFRSRFGVEVIELSCLTNDQKSSYEAGYDAAVVAFLDGIYGAGSVIAAYQEVQERRKKRYDDWIAANKDTPA